MSARSEVIGGFVAALLVGVAPACGGDDDGAADTMNDDGEVGEVVDTDRFDPVCGTAKVPLPTVCGDATTQAIPSRGANHIPDGTAITYVDSPPSSGDHRPAWAKWGEFEALPPQRWLHNLEHGGLAFLYDPCVDDGAIATLRALAKAQAPDDGGPFRWVMTPYPGLGGVALVAWENTWRAACVDDGNGESAEAFIAEHYRKSPEDVASDGSYATGWIGR